MDQVYIYVVEHPKCTERRKAWAEFACETQKIAVGERWSLSFSIVDTEEQVVRNEATIYAVFAHIRAVSHVEVFDAALGKLNMDGGVCDAWVYSENWQDRNDPQMKNAWRMVNIPDFSPLFGPPAERLPTARRAALVGRLRMLAQGGMRADPVGFPCLKYLGNDERERRECLLPN
jgi:hypothetical protein